MSTTPPVRVRMAPSPTGSPHVGLVRTALYNWAFARHHGGTFVFRIEDTDAARNDQASYDALLDLFRWLGLDWDEGPEVGGDHGPYRQSERADIYADALARLAEAGHTYRCFCTTEEVEARRKASGSKVMGYDRHCRDLTDEQVAAFEAEGRAAVVRFRMPDGEIAFDDLVRGRVSFHSDHVPDYALARANGHPLYTLVNPVDDALMEITHVLRGEDLLSSTPRQVPLYAALADVGIGTGAPEFGHLPYVMGQGNKKLSKRDPEANALGYRDDGFLPEGLLNYVALLGWAIAADRDVFTLEEMVAAFEIGDVNPNPARFDLKKADAINASHMRLLCASTTSPTGCCPSSRTPAWSATPSPTPTRSCSSSRCRWSPSGSTSSPRPSTCSGSCSSTRPTSCATRRTSPSCSTSRAARSCRRRTTRVSGLHEWSTAAIQEALQGALVDDAGAQAAGGVRAGPRGRHRTPHLTAAVRVDGAARPRAQPGPAAVRAGVTLGYHRLHRGGRLGRPRLVARPGRRRRCSSCSPSWCRSWSSPASASSTPHVVSRSTRRRRGSPARSSRRRSCWSSTSAGR